MSHHDLSEGESIVQAHKAFLIASHYSASSVNQRLTAIRKFALRATERGVIRTEEAVAIQRVI